jgi:polysaccharide export outer membrane protein
MSLKLPISLPGAKALIVTLIIGVSDAGCAASLNNGTVSQNTFGDGFAAQQSSAAPANSRAATAVAFASAAAATSSYRVGPLDVLDISVFNVPDLSKSVQVSGSGTINLPLIGEMAAAGKSTEELERELTQKLGEKYLQNPQVTVLVKEYNSQKVTVEGSVNKPGVYPITTDTSLLQLVALAGDFQQQISDYSVLIIRTTHGRRSAARFDVADIQKGRMQDPMIQAGDVVVAGTSAIKQGFNTILKALPLAGVFAFL